MDFITIKTFLLQKILSRKWKDSSRSGLLEEAQAVGAASSRGETGRPGTGARPVSRPRWSPCPHSGGTASFLPDFLTSAVGLLFSSPTSVKGGMDVGRARSGAGPLRTLRCHQQEPGYSISERALMPCHAQLPVPGTGDDGEEAGSPPSRSQSNSLLCDAHLCFHCIGYKNLLLE